MDDIARRRRVRSYLLQAAQRAPAIGEKESILEALMKQQDWDVAAPDRWLGPDATELNNDHQISPTEPMPRRVKATPTTLGQTLPVKSPPPNVSGGTAS